ncbi:MAG: YCF48-related protein [bacterium]
MKKAQVIIMVLLFSALCYSYETSEALYGVCFKDQNHGWIVGNKGLILCTDNGGKTWEKQKSNTFCVLRKVFFINKKRGWAVGGTTRLDRTGGNGIILSTLDGGKNWTVQSYGVTPYLYDVKFINEKTGWVTGEARDGSDNSLWKTADGGKTWQWVKSGSRFWHFGIAAGSRGDVWVCGDDCEIISYDKKNNKMTGSFALENKSKLVRWHVLRSVSITGTKGIVAVGSNGCIVYSKDNGKTWQQGTTDLSAGVLRSCDLNTVEFTDSKTGYAGGKIGSFILKTRDGGVTWKILPTGTRPEIMDISFINKNQGWAAGQLGTVIRTFDGGNTWEDLSLGRPDIDILAVVAHHDDENVHLVRTMGHYAADLGMNIGVYFVTTDDRRSRNYFGETSWQESRDVNNQWGAQLVINCDELTTMNKKGVAWGEQAQKNQWLPDDPLEIAEGVLVAAIRTYRPKIIITHEPLYGDYNKMGHIQSGVLATRAFNSASLKTEYTELLGRVFLKEHGAQSLYYKGFGIRKDLPPGFKVYPPHGPELYGGMHAAGITWPCFQYSPALGCTYQEANYAGRCLYHSKEVDIPNILRIAVGLNSLREGMHLFQSRVAPGEDLIFSPPKKNMPEWELKRKSVVEQEKQLMKILESNIGDQKNGKGDKNILEALEKFVKEHKDNPAGIFAQCILSQLLTDAGEIDRGLAHLKKYRERTGNVSWADNLYYYELDLLKKYKDDEEYISAINKMPEVLSGRPESREYLILKGEWLMGSGKYKAALTAFEEFEKRNILDGELWDFINLREAICLKMLGDNNGYQQLFRKIVKRENNGRWHRCAVGELAILSGKEKITQRVLFSNKAKEDIKLDGLLSESDWKSAKLSSDFEVQQKFYWHRDSIQQTKLRALYNNKGIYLGIEAMEKRANLPEAKDNEFWIKDKIIIYWDINRDYLTMKGITIQPDGKIKGELIDKKWHAIEVRDVQVGIQINRDNWTAELFFPWSFFNRSGPDGEKYFGLNVFRDRYADIVKWPDWPVHWEISQWSYPDVIRRNGAVELFGYLKLD